MPNLPEIESTLNMAGLGPYLARLKDGPLTGNIELPFIAMKTAKRMQRILYQWLSFHPAVKERVTLSVSPTLPILTIKHRTSPETRGRKRNRLR